MNNCPTSLHLPSGLGRCVAWLCWGLWAVLLVTPAHAAKHALVIGNASYTVGALKNPRNDAKDMAVALRALGYDIYTDHALIDLDRSGMEKALAGFARGLGEQDVALVFYAGHGISSQRRNYLVPLGADINWEAQLPERSISVDSIAGLLESYNSAGLNILLLDACRDNPLARSFGRSGSRGLVRNASRLPRGSFIGYAADESQTAGDGQGRNGIYTTELLYVLKHHATDPIDRAHRRVAQRVFDQTQSSGQPQFPVADSKYIGDYCFGACFDENAARRDAEQQAAEQQAAEQQAAEQQAAEQRRAKEASQAAEQQAADAARAKAEEKSREQAIAAQLETDRIESEQLTEQKRAAAQRQAAELEASRRQTAPAVKTGRLWVKAKPVDARVRIMNIGPKYTDGIALELGKRYDVLVSKSGYQSWREQVLLSSAEQVVIAVLEKEPEIQSEFEPAARAAKRQSYEPEMVDIPGGSFSMGDLSGKGNSYTKPVHQVNVSAFRLAKTEVTFAQYDAYVSASSALSPNDSGWGRGQRPVLNVSWNSAQGYIKWLNGKTGKEYRLPSEAEWEYAARAGSSTKYSWGNQVGSNRADCDRCGSQWDDEQTAPVASFAANRWGLHDMHGNVWEWVQDTWHGDYGGAPSDGAAWVSGDESRRVLRGGSWDVHPWVIRAAFRDWFAVSSRDSAAGFRLAEDTPR